MDDPASPTGDGRVVEATFEVSDSVYPFVGVTEAADCRAELERMLPRGEDRYAEFFTFAGVDPDRVLAFTEKLDLVDTRLVTAYESGGLFEFVVSKNCPAWELAELGAVPQTVVGEDGRGRIAAEIPSDRDPSAVISEFLDRHPSAELFSKQQTDGITPIFTTEQLELTVEERLTDRQQELLLAAYEAGYYDRTSDTTGEEIAAEFGIGSSTLSQHLAAAERKLVAVFVDDVVDSPSI
jgi:hypothetical protein